MPVARPAVGPASGGSSLPSCVRIFMAVCIGLFLVYNLSFIKSHDASPGTQEGKTSMDTAAATGLQSQQWPPPVPASQVTGGALTSMDTAAAAAQSHAQTRLPAAAAAPTTPAIPPSLVHPPASNAQATPVQLGSPTGAAPGLSWPAATRQPEPATTPTAASSAASSSSIATEATSAHPSSAHPSSASASPAATSASSASQATASTVPAAAPAAEQQQQQQPRQVPEKVKPSRVTTTMRLPPTPLLQDAAFEKAVFDAAVDNTLIISVGDQGFIDMLSNIVVTSIQRFKIENFLVIGLTKGMCTKLPPGTKCFEVTGRAGGGSYGSKEFANLVNIKTEVVMASVALGYRTLLVDGDIVFLKNPLPFLDGPYDLHIQDDDMGGRNSGFMMMKANSAALTFLGRSLAIARQAKNMRQQPAVNKALEEMGNKLKVKVLSDAEFPCGMKYFEKPVRRMFAFEHPCEQCVVMHNNWIVGSHAKVYRFKEHAQWFVDRQQYYTSTTAKYLQFDLPDHHKSKSDEAAALATAFKLADALGRIVILPIFHCHKCSVTGAGGAAQACAGYPGDADQCNFAAHWKVDALDKSGLPYREAMFRRHPWVPSAVKENNEEVTYKLGDATGSSNLRGAPSPVHLQTESGAAVTHADLKQWFGAQSSSPVLHFRSLYNVQLGFADDASWSRKVKAALQSSSPRQY